MHPIWKVLSSSYCLASITHQHFPSDKTGVVRSQETSRGGHFIRRSLSLEESVVGKHLSALFQAHIDQPHVVVASRGLHCSRSQAVHTDLVRRKVHGATPGECYNSSLGAVVG